LFSFEFRREAREWRRPWKLALLAIGMAWLVYGATHYNFSDWDLGISFLMGPLAYLLAPWSIRVFYDALRAPKQARLADLLLALLFGWFTVDGVYLLYHTLKGNEMVREANFYASGMLFLLAGAVWAWRGSAAELLAAVRKELQARN
jgi:hypothetical protein